VEGKNVTSDADERGLVPSGLKGLPWFTGCTDAQLTQLASLCEHLAVDADEVILREGRLGRELFVIVEGNVTVTRKGAVVNTLGPGDYFGELGAIEAAPRNATVTATTALDVLVIGPREFDAIMSIPAIRNALLRGMSRRIREADARMSADGGQAPAGDTATG
jgi:CRP-like cAMP-binding protein